MTLRLSIDNTILSLLGISSEKYSLSKFLLTILAYVCEYLLNMTIILFLVNVVGIKKVFAPTIAPVFSTIPMFFLMRFIIKKEK